MKEGIPFDYDPLQEAAGIFAEGEILNRQVTVAMEAHEFAHVMHAVHSGISVFADDQEMVQRLTDLQQRLPAYAISDEKTSIAVSYSDVMIIGAVMRDYVRGEAGFDNAPFEYVAAIRDNYQAFLKLHEGFVVGGGRENKEQVEEFRQIVRLASDALASGKLPHQPDEY